jgi:hypothetical protein
LLRTIFFSTGVTEKDGGQSHDRFGEISNSDDAPDETED